MQPNCQEHGEIGYNSLLGVESVWQEERGRAFGLSGQVYIASIGSCFAVPRPFRPGSYTMWLWWLICLTEELIRGHNIEKEDQGCQNVN